MPIFTSKYPSFSYDKPFGIIQTLFESKAQNENPNRPCFVDALTGKVLTFKQMKEMVFRFGAGLQDVCGFKEGDVLALYTPNVVDFAVPAFGTLAVGGIVSPANPTYNVEELAYQLNESKAKVIIAHPSNVKNAIHAAEKVNIPRTNIFIFGDAAIKDIQPYSKVLLGNRMVKSVKFKTAKQEQDTVAFLCFSSGTTGKSKGVMTTHENLIACIMQYYTIQTTISSATTRVLCSLPFFHIYGLISGILATLYKQIPTVILPRFDLEQFCSAIIKYKITLVNVVPPILLLLATHPIVDKYNLPSSSLTDIVSGAAPLDIGLIARVEQRLGKNIKVTQGYGLTETSPLVALQPIACNKNSIIPGSAGFLVPNMLAKFVDENGNEVGVGERGEIWVKGPNLMKGYLNRPEETKECIDSEGYFHTGDIGTIDSNGHIFIVDRVKELIKYKGFQVAPAELEALLLKNENVVDCAVIGVYDQEQVTEIPRAYIVLKKDVNPNEQTVEEIKKFVADNVATFKQIRSVIFRDTIPKSPTGKILRNILRNEVKKEEEEKRKNIASKL